MRAKLRAVRSWSPTFPQEVVIMVGELVVLALGLGVGLGVAVDKLVTRH